MADVLSGVFHALPEPAVVSDDTGRVVVANARMLAALGEEDPSEVVGHPIDRFLVPVAGPKVPERSFGGPPEVEVRRRDGTSVPMAVVRYVFQSKTHGRLLVHLLRETPVPRLSSIQPRLLSAIERAAREADSSVAAATDAARFLAIAVGWPTVEVWEARGGAFHLANSLGLEPLPTDLFHEAGRSRPQVAGGLIGLAAAERRGTWVPSLSRSPDFMRGSEAMEAGLGAGMAWPVIVAGEVPLVVAIYSPQGVRGTPEILSLGEVATRFLARSMELQELGMSEGEGARPLTTLLDAAPIAAVALDSAGRITHWNPSATRLFGWSAEEVLGRPNPFFLEETGGSEAMREALRGHRPLRDVDVRLPKKDGSVADVRLSMAPLPGRGGRPNGAVALAVDVTERRRLERRILELSSRERARIGRDIHDGLGQILTGISFLSTSLSRTLHAQGRTAEAEDADRIREHVRKAVEVARRISEGVHPLSEAGGLVAALDQLSQRATTAFDLTCSLRVVGRGRKLPPEMSGHLFLLVQEAVTNVVRHADASRIRIIVLSRPTEICLRVSDDGRGFPVEEAGGGLGLNTMRYRAQGLGGTLSITSRTPGGTRVSAVVPFPPGEEEA
ncbi:MAG: PAS domain-containing protein [Longimicrobiales bacterium]